MHSLKDLPTEDAHGVVVGAVTRARGRPRLPRRARRRLARGAAAGRGRRDEQPAPRRAAPRRSVPTSRSARSAGTSTRGSARSRTGEFDAARARGRRRAAARPRGGGHGVARGGDDAPGARPGRARDAVPCRRRRRCSRFSRRSTIRPHARRRRPSGRSCARSAPAARRRSRRSRSTTTTPRVRLQGLVASVDGRQVVRVSRRGRAARARRATRARRHSPRGADRILAAIRG